MKSTGFRAAGIAGIAIAVAAVLAMPAGADTRRFDSTVTVYGLGPDPTYVDWVGDVYSRKRRCERGRTVAVYYDEGTGPELVGEDLTDRHGHWQIDANLIGDDPYYAVVRRKVVRRGDNKIVCKSDRSPRFRLPAP